MLKKLRARFVVVNMSIVLGMLLIIFGVLFHFVSTDLEKDTQAVLQSMAQDALQSSVPQRADTNLRYFTIRLNARGEILAYGVTDYDLDNKQFLQQLILDLYDQRKTEGYLENYGLRYYMIETRDLLVAAFVDESGYEQVLNSLVLSAVIIGAFSLLIFFFTSLLLARWTVKPVETAWKQQKQFVSDASHELKTPLTVIMGNAELLQSTEDEETKKRYSANILTMSHRMRSLVEGLLDLSRVDNGKVKQSFAKLDFSKLAEDAVLPFEPVFFEKGLVFQSNIEEGIVINGSEQYLSQLVQILLDNAVKYSAPGIVELQLQRRARNQALLTVSNPGTPIDHEEKERIFDRFYRSDKARSGTGSFGLGLAIAKSTVTEHGGKIWVDSNQSGNCFCVLLPCE